MVLLFFITEPLLALIGGGVSVNPLLTLICAIFELINYVSLIVSLPKLIFEVANSLIVFSSLSLSSR